MTDSFEILIRKFLANKCTKDEADVVIDKLLREPHLIEKYLPIKEWEDYTNSKNYSISKIINDRIESNSFKNIYKKRPYRLYKYASAACIIFIISIFNYLHFYDSKTITDYAGKTSLLINEIDFNGYNSIANNDNYDKEIHLEDGSIVILTPGSDILFNKYFSSKRNIFLNGDAYFIVAKDKKHPFKVFENGVSITALGTEFWVKNNPSNRSVSVSLHKGKVAIKPYKNDFTFDETILLAGQDFTINNAERVTILNLNQTASSYKKLKEKYIEEYSKINAGTDKIEFHYTPIDQVIKTLESYFNVDIQIENNKNLAKNQFTGKIFLKDSLNIILNKISEMNNLNFKIIPKNLIIRKEPQSSMIFYVEPLQKSFKTNPAFSNDIIKAPKTFKNINITSKFILFEYTPLADVFQTLSDCYGQSIEYKGLLNNEFTGKIYHNIPLEKIIINICKINKLKYSKKNNTIIVYE